MSQLGVNMQNEAAAALHGAPPSPGGQQQPQPGAQQGGGIGAFMQAYARCEQTKNCTPQDRQILEQGLPNLLQIAKAVQMILQATAQGGGAPQPGQQPPQQ